jgi:hypothetical protein
VTEEEFSVSLRAFCGRRPFRHFLIEFFNGQQIQVKHPEGVDSFGGVWLFHEPQSNRVVVFASSSVCRLLDPPEG